MKDINTMTEEEINLEIAKFMGFIIQHCEHDNSFFSGPIAYYSNGVPHPHGMPLYTKDLNLVYEVEEKLYEYLDKSKNMCRGHYLVNLESLMKYGFPLTDILHASSLDRCRAILMTIKESERNELLSLWEMV